MCFSIDIFEDGFKTIVYGGPGPDRKDQWCIYFSPGEENTKDIISSAILPMGSLPDYVKDKIAVVLVNRFLPLQKKCVSLIKLGFFFAYPTR